MLADHVVRMALQKELSNAVVSGILCTYDYHNEVSSNAGLQQSTHCTCDIADLEWVFPLTPALFSAPDPTHYHEYIYDHMTTPHQLKSASPRFWATYARAISFVEKGGSEDTTIQA